MKPIFNVEAVTELKWELSQFLDRKIVESKEHYTEEDAMQNQEELYAIVDDRFKVIEE